MGILIVDDNLLSIKLAAAFLEGLGRNIFQATSSIEGLKMLGSASISLVLTNYEMPQMDGMEFATTIRRESKYKHIPIVLMTSRYDITHAADEAYKVFDAILHKPISCDALLKHVKNLLCSSGIKRIKEE